VSLTPFALQVFEVTRDVACVAVTIKEVLEDTESDTAIPLPNLWYSQHNL